MYSDSCMVINLEVMLFYSNQIANRCFMRQLIMPNRNITFGDESTNINLLIIIMFLLFFTIIKALLALKLYLNHDLFVRSKSNG